MGPYGNSIWETVYDKLYIIIYSKDVYVLYKAFSTRYAVVQLGPIELGNGLVH